MIFIHSILIGQPEEITDAEGVWTSSIRRKVIAAPTMLTERGLEGDRMADTKHHGHPDQAVCCHSFEHYEHWNKFYNLEGAARLGPGTLGENWTLCGVTEDDICVGDVYKGRHGTRAGNIGAPNSMR